MKNINIRFGDALHSELKTAAEQDRRSFNSEVQWLLIFALAARTAAPGPRLDSESWTCAGCSGQMIGRRPADDLCNDCDTASSAKR